MKRLGVLFTMVLGLAAVVFTVTPARTELARSGDLPDDAATQDDVLRARDEIWAMELAVYAGRGDGDLQPYLEALASDYKAWPPFREAPAGEEGLLDLASRMQGQDQEELEMTLVDFSLNGSTAAIYYRTHRTRQPDGTPANDFYEVIHVWVKEHGEWRVFAGMARDTPQR